MRLGANDTLGVDSVVSVEFAFGDGSGWVDLTAVFRNLYETGYLSPEIDPVEDYYEHSYTQPGEYRIRGRVTWWDGEITTAVFPATIVVLPPEGSGGESSGGGDPEDDEWVIVSFTDPRDGTTYDIIDGRALIAFRLPLDQAAAEQFLADMELSSYSEWWEVGAVGVLLPEGVSVLEAVTDWPAQHPELIESVDPDAVGEAQE